MGTLRRILDIDETRRSITTYEAEYKKLKQEFWERRKRTHLEGEEILYESLKCGKYPPEALNASRRKTRARESSVPMERRSARVTRNITQRGKGTDRPVSGAIASSSNSDTNKTKYKYSTERRQSKTKYRRQHTQVVEKESPSPSQAYYVNQRP